MLVQVGLEGEGLAAPPAHVRLLGAVGLDVGPQVGLVGEALAALRARERLLAGVRADVALQQPRPGEPLAAVRARAALVVRAHVHAECGHGHVDLVAVWALPGFLVAVGAVRLAVAGQVGRRAVPLAALLARVRLLPGQRRLGRRQGRGRRRRDGGQAGGEQQVVEGASGLVARGGVSGRHQPAVLGHLLQRGAPVVVVLRPGRTLLLLLLLLLLVGVVVVLLVMRLLDSWVVRLR